MGTEQYRDGAVSVITASQIVLGDDTDWTNEIVAGQIFKVDLDGESTYSISSVVNATRLILSSKYGGDTNSGLDYIICRNFTANRSWYRPSQGDFDWAEILSLETLDKIDTDIANLQSDIIGKETHTDDYQVTTGDAGKSLRMNSTTTKRYWMPEVDSNSDGIRVPMAKINSGRLSILAAPGDKVRNSAHSGLVYCNVATQLHANMTLEYIDAVRRWIDVGDDGTWVTEDPVLGSTTMDALLTKEWQKIGLDAILTATPY